MQAVDLYMLAHGRRDGDITADDLPRLMAAMYPAMFAGPIDPAVYQLLQRAVERLRLKPGRSILKSDFIDRILEHGLEATLTRWQGCRKMSAPHSLVYARAAGGSGKSYKATGMMNLVPASVAESEDAEASTFL